MVAEALTNAAKHSQASEVVVRVCFDGDDLHIEVRDDGIGGAIAGGGSGIVGLRDRVEALSGRLEVTSPSGGGTTLIATIPPAPEAQPDAEVPLATSKSPIL